MGLLMKSKMDGTDVTPLFHEPSRKRLRQKSGSRTRRSSCNCTHINVGPAFVIDHIPASGQKEIYVYDRDTNNVWASDMNNCICRLIVNGSESRDAGNSSVIILEFTCNEDEE